MFRTHKNPENKTPAEPTKTSPAGQSPSKIAPAYQGSMHNQTQASTPTTTPAVSESEGLARDIKEGTMSGFVGNATSLSGEVAFKGMLRVDGKISGNVTSEDGTLIVSTNGLVEADIDVAVAQIHGAVKGDIIASKRIEMGRVARVNGNIFTPSLVVEQGAHFEGSCRMADRPSSRQEARKKMKELGITSGVAGS